MTTSMYKEIKSKKELWIILSRSVDLQHLQR